MLRKHLAVLLVPWGEHISHLDPHRTYAYACGADTGDTYHAGYFTPSRVDCTACKASAKYKETLIAIEIGYDGSQDAWWDALRGLK